MEKLVHEMAVDLRKAKVSKRSSKKDGEKKEKKETPKQLAAWLEEVKAVREEYAEKGKKITQQEAIQIASKRRGNDEEKPKKKSKKDDSDDEEKPVKKVSKKSKKEESDDEEEEKPKKKAAKKEAKKEVKKEVEEGTELEEWSYEGQAYLKSSLNEVWMQEGDGLGKWVGVYNPVDDSIDTTASEPEVSL